MEIRKTKGGIYEVTNPIVDLSKEINDKYTQIKRPRLGGLLGSRRTIYIPNDYAPKPKMSKLAAGVAGTALLLGIGSGCATQSPFSPIETGYANLSTKYDNATEIEKKGKGKVITETQEALNKEAGQLGSINHDERKAKMREEMERVINERAELGLGEGTNLVKRYDESDLSHLFELGLYGFGRQRELGDAHTDMKRSPGLIGAELRVKPYKGLFAYGRAEIGAEVSNNQSDSICNCTSETKTDAYGLGIGYGINITDWLNLKGHIGAFNMNDRMNNTIIFNGSNKLINDCASANVFGGEIGFQAGFDLGPIILEAGLTGEVFEGGKNRSIERGLKGTLGVVIPLGRGKK